MSQEQSTINRKKRTRIPRNRPVLVTGADNEESSEQETTSSTTGTLVADTEETNEEAAEETTTETSTPSKQRGRASRLPAFFARVEKDDDSSSTDEKTVVEARMARAKKSSGIKGATAAATTVTPEKESKKSSTSTTSSKSTTSDKPPSLFKMRHIIGMLIYLLAAQLLLEGEKTLFTANHFDPVFVPTFSLFGFPVTIDLVFVTAIATLILLLYTLVHFNLLPNSKEIAAQQTQSKSTTSTKSKTTSTPVEKAQPPSVRPGVQGEDDDLYKEYRLNQRRDKKR